MRCILFSWAVHWQSLVRRGIRAFGGLSDASITVAQHSSPESSDFDVHPCPISQQP